MAQQLCAPLAESWILGPARQLPPMPSDGDSTCSSAWSRNSWGSARARSSPLPGSRPAQRAGTPGRRRAHGGRLGTPQRQSASEREKLRMRRLARALHDLRRFLPPSVVPAGQSLTKIETLRLAIRYISHLSAMLGLSEDSLRRRRSADTESHCGCPLCPDGSPAQAQLLGCGLSLEACSGSSRGSSSACPRPGVAPEPCDSSLLYTQASSERQAMEASALSPLFTSEVLALLETWVPLSPQEWPPA